MGNQLFCFYLEQILKFCCIVLFVVVAEGYGVRLNLLGVFLDGVWGLSLFSLTTVMDIVGWTYFCITPSHFFFNK